MNFRLQFSKNELWNYSTGMGRQETQSPGRVTYARSCGNSNEILVHCMKAELTFFPLNGVPSVFTCLRYSRRYDKNIRTGISLSVGVLSVTN